VHGGHKLRSSWFWTSHALLQQLTGSCQKTVQRGIKELQEEGFIGYHPAKKQGQQCFFKINRIKYNTNQKFVPDVRLKSKPVEKEAPKSPGKPDPKQNEKKGKRPVKLEIPYKEGVLFQSGKDTHDDKGRLIDKDGGDWITDIDFAMAERIMEKEGEEAFLEQVIKMKIENHLVPEYREKLAKMEN